MPRPALRSRSLRRVYVKLPGGRTTIHYERRKNGKAKCALCHKLLHGVQTKGSKTEKRPERMYGGYYCHSCLRELIKKAVKRGL